MSLYPYAALLIGVVVERCCEERQRDWWSRSWDRFLLIGSGAVALSGILAALASVLGLLDRVGLRGALSTPLIAVYLLACLLLAYVMVWSRGRSLLPQAEAGVLAMACFMGLTHTGLVMSAQVHNSNNPALAIAEVRALIPPGERLMSIDKVHHMFAYYYGDSIELQRVGTPRIATEMPGQYFCFAVDPEAKPFEIPFAWQCVAEISCERTRTPEPRTKVVVGRRLDYEPRVGRTAVRTVSFSAAIGRPSSPETARRKATSSSK
jgi:hypothetical protein